jgi:hypothetical protein
MRVNTSSCSYSTSRPKAEQEQEYEHETEMKYAPVFLNGRLKVLKTFP